LQKDNTGVQNVQNHKDRLEKIKLLLLDVDGVMTDGTIIYDDNNTEIKQFYARDGLGIRLVMRAGIKVGVVTGRRSEALIHRCRNLGIELIFDGIEDKAALLGEITTRTALSVDEIAFVGDDLVDLSLMQKVGLSIAVADAHEIVKARADIVTKAQGGAGAVREICESLLKSQHQWEDILKEFS
jgi:3-deoxy-D-manno-octulosonate 8-phosphate phosphatase (KDO 8-P phosphatase)